MSTKNEVKIHQIREELSEALNNWQDLESTKTIHEIVEPAPNPPRKKKLLKAIKQQLESLSL